MADRYICLISRDVRHLTIPKHIFKYNSKIGKLIKYYEMLVGLNPLPEFGSE